MFDASHLVQSGGLLLIAVLIFAESGMFIGFFFPGDTLLLSAGIFAAQGKLSLAPIIIVAAAAAILGDNVGYQIGRRFGHRLFTRDDSFLFNKEYIERAHKFYERFGNRTMLLAHFVAVVRTFAPPVAGAANMPFRQFFFFDAIGDTAWAALVTLIGYWFGRKVPNIDHYIMLAVLAVIILTLGPALYHFEKSRRARNRKKLTDSSEHDSTDQ